MSSFIGHSLAGLTTYAMAHQFQADRSNQSNQIDWKWILWLLVIDISFRADGKMLASAGDDGSIRPWDISKDRNQNGQLLSGHSKPVMSVSFIPNGKLLASGSKGKTVRIWQLS
ncbi:WD40 repeat domain-containing protein [Pseudanabaena sp. PCC 6802]|uniref:WD40 repeat domain-containing protein n=1 Tax=Pseudanabaena sp. PCC 6802 TaxID=118173 RepID=UPI00034C7674|nr:hypothetical protein [Pseudanabaena sp. PCC 6802]